MRQLPASSKTTGSQVIYAGRFADRVSDANLPEGFTLLDDWDVLPARLADVMEGASTLVVLDLFSFPFEALTGVQMDVPLIVVLPTGLDTDFLTTVFGRAVFKHLDFFDRVATPDQDVWEILRQRYGWAESQRVGLESGDPGEALREIGAVLEAESVPHRAICSVRHGPDKAMHRVQEAALGPQFAAARGARADDVPFDVLEVGVGMGRWTASFDLAKTRFFGVDINEGMVAAARANFPEGRFDRLGSDLLLPYDDESFDLVFSVTVMHHNPTPAKGTLLSEMWRVARQGGRLLFLEDFVAGRWSEKSTVYPMSVLEFVGLLLEATNWQVTLEHVESLRYPHDDVTRGGIIAVSKLGVPKRW